MANVTINRKLTVWLLPEGAILSELSFNKFAIKFSYQIFQEMSGD